jgi:hypothetical protein
MPVTFRLVLAAFLLFVSINVKGQTGLAICSNPKTPCQHRDKEFAPYELSFRLPGRLRQNYDYKSVPFYAVVLKTYKDFEAGGDGCDGGEFSTAIEDERKKAQKLFPDQKAFASYQCPDMGAVLYKSGTRDLNDTFMAVYGGTTITEAQGVLAKAKANYPAASLKRMVAIYNWQVE